MYGGISHIKRFINLQKVLICMILAPWSIVKVVLFILIGIFLVSLLFFLLSIRPARYYDDSTPAKYGLEYSDESFVTSDGIEIKAWLIESESAKGTVIIGHGYPFDKGNILH